MVDEEIFTNNPDVIAGDSGIVFKTRNGDNEYLAKGDPVKVGDKIVIHHTSDGDLITHGNSRIGVGDRVIVVRGKDGDLCALHAGQGNPYRDCPLIHHTTEDVSQPHDPPDDDWQYHAYDIHLERPITRDPETGDWAQVHARFDFGVEFNEEGFQCWYPHGGVWIGVSEDGDNWWWQGSNNPYTTISGPPEWYCGDGAQWCIQYFTNWIAPPGTLDEINYVHVHIRSASSLYWINHVKTRLLYSTFCEGDLREGFCDSLDDLGIRSQL
jgi:hypothetical protein